MRPFTLLLLMFLFSSHWSLSNGQEKKVFRYGLHYAAFPEVRISNGWILKVSDDNLEKNFLKHQESIPASVISSVTLKVLKSAPVNPAFLPSPELIPGEFMVDTEIIEIRGAYFFTFSLNPVRINEDGLIEAVQEFSIELQYHSLPSSASRNSEFTSVSALSTGELYKITIPRTGVYKLDKAFLESKLGLDVSKINPKKIKLFANRGGRMPESNAAPRTDDLQELAIEVFGEGDEKFDNSDYVLFYAEGADIWRFNSTTGLYSFDKHIYDDYNYVFLKLDNQNGRRIEKAIPPLNTPGISVGEYDMLQRLEEDRTNLLGAYIGTEGTGKEWYGDYFSSAAKEKNLTSRFDFSGLVAEKPIELEMIFAGRSNLTSQLTLNLGGKVNTRSIPSVNITNAQAEYAKKSVVRDNILLSESTPSVILTYPSSANNAEGWLDYIQLVHSRKLIFNNSQLPFRSRATAAFSEAAFLPEGYTSQEVWDVTDPFSPRLCELKNGVLSFVTEGVNREFVAHNRLAGAFEPLSGKKIPVQNLHSATSENMLLVYHPNFEKSALDLAAHREKVSGIKVITADVTKVYNEFSGGKTDPVAIRDMARMMYSRNPEFKYILLFGDGSYDYKNIVKDIPFESFVPAYQTDESLNPINGFPSDDFYGLLGPAEGVNLTGAMDIYVGRLPAKSADEAKVLVDKIIHYDTSPATLGEWRINAGYVADDEDGNTHLRDMDDIARADEIRHPVMVQQKVYADAYKQISTPGENRYPEANKSINDNIFKGQLSLTYLGHGGPLGWAQERILTVPDIQSWTNKNSLSILITATCSFGAFDEPAVVSPAEYALLNPKGGAIALMTTTREVYTNSNKQLTDAAHELLFRKVNGKAPTLGYVLAEGKNKYSLTSESFRVNSRKFVLLGDPSMSVALPALNVVTSKINGRDALTGRDTLSALEKVTVEGYISNPDGGVAQDFNGTIYPVVYDKKASLQTLANDSGSSKFNFTMYRNILFKGEASVKNGYWSFSFWVPQNINYTFGPGRISYYASDEKKTDAAGSYTGVWIGGSAENPVADDEGPLMRLFMNDTTFVDGGITNNTPVLLMHLTDDLGISVTGNAIGQDITAVLDGDDQNIFILNEFYKAQKDDYTKGTVRFPLGKLDPGPHLVETRAWDISGNSTRKRIEFVVADSKNDKIQKIYAFPNPFRDNTTFAFEHDLGGEELDIVIKVYSLTGQLVKILKKIKYYDGFNVNDVMLNDSDHGTTTLANGMYLYQVTLTGKQSGQVRVSEYEKLIKM